MHIVRSNNDDMENNEDPGRSFFNGLKRLTQALKTLGESTKHLSADYNVRICHVLLSSESDGLILAYTYKNRDFKGNLRFATFLIPVFDFLRDKELDVNEDEINEDAILPSQNNIGYLDRFMKILYKPITISMTGVLSIANIINIGSTLAKIKILQVPLLARLPLLYQLGIFGLSVVYFVPAFGYYYSERYVRKELEDVFSKTLSLIKEGYYVSAYEIFSSLSFKHKILLHPNYPGNSDLIWSYYHIQACFTENFELGFHKFDFNTVAKKAWELSRTTDQKFQILRLIINNSDLNRKRNIGYIIEETKLMDEDNKIKRNDGISRTNQRHQDLIAKYISQLPVNSKMHIKHAKSLHSELQATYEDINNGKIEDACKRFNLIELGGYNKLAFPAAAAFYHQLESALTMLSMRMKENRVNPDLCPYFRRRFAHDSFAKIQRYLERFDASLAQVNNKYKQHFDYAERSLIVSDEPILAMPSFTKKWVMEREKYIEKSEEKLEKGLLKRSSSMSEIIQSKKQIGSRPRNNSADI